MDYAQYKIPIAPLLEHLELSGINPIRKEATNSFSIMPDGIHWKDFGSGERGDAIDLLTLMGNDFTTAISIIEGACIPAVRQKAHKPSQQMAKTLPEEQLQKYKSNLLNMLDDSPHNHLTMMNMSQLNEYKASHTSLEIRGAGSSLHVDGIKINSSIYPHLEKLLPREYWDVIPSFIGYDSAQQTVTVQLADTLCWHRYNTGLRHGIVKWYTRGSKKYSPMKLENGGKVYVCSGIGEYVLLELLGVDYIVSQSDSIVPEIDEDKIRERELIIIPDNDDSGYQWAKKVKSAYGGTLWRWDNRPKGFDLKDLAHELDKDILLSYFDDAVTAKTYQESMTKLWVDEYGMPKSNKLVSNWNIFAQTMNQVIRDNTSKYGSKRYVIPMATGESKTQGTIIFTSLLLDSGIKTLIVTRQKSEADYIASEICDRSGRIDYCVAIHGSSSCKHSDANRFDAVVVTHSFFNLHGARNSSKWKMISEGRKLCIVDEALDSVRTARVDSYKLEQLRRVIVALDRARFKGLLKDIEGTQKLISHYGDIFLENTDNDNKQPFYLVQHENSMDDTFSANVISSVAKEHGIESSLLEGFSKGDAADIFIEKVEMFESALREYSNKRPLVTRAIGIKESSREMAYRLDMLNVIDDLKTITRCRTFISSGITDMTLHSAEENLPSNMSFAVLDATSSINRIYSVQEMYQRNISVVDVAKSRTYKNFTINYSRINTGTSSMSDAKVIDDVLRSIPIDADDKVLIVSTKKVEAFIKRRMDQLQVSVVDLQHYGNITGKNDWRDFDVVVLIGLPHKPSSHYQGLLASKSNDEIAFSEMGDSVRQQIYISDLAQEAAQAIARIGVRKMIDEDGNCPPCKAFITLDARKAFFEEEMSLLEQQFPDATFKPWTIHGQDTLKRPKGFDATISYVAGRLGSIGQQMIVYEPRDTLDLAKESYRRLLKDKQFLEVLKAHGVEILVPPNQLDKNGRALKRGKKYFVRSEAIDDF